jgi:malate dehydrogenase (quinone)
MLELLQKCFPDKTQVWENRLKQIIPSYGQSLSKDPTLLKNIRSMTSEVLGIVAEPVKAGYDTAR